MRILTTDWSINFLTEDAVDVYHIGMLAQKFGEKAVPYERNKLQLELIVDKSKLLQALLDR